MEPCIPKPVSSQWSLLGAEMTVTIHFGFSKAILGVLCLQGTGLALEALDKL